MARDLFAELKQSGWAPQQAGNKAGRNLLAGLSAAGDVGWRGVVASAAGAPVDMANMVQNALREAYNLGADKKVPLSENPVGGSEWIGQKMQEIGLVSKERRPAAEMIAGLASPDAGDLLKVAAVIPAVKKYYRFTNSDSPMSRAGYAMFADDPNAVSFYGKNKYVFEDSGDAVDASSLYDDIVRALSNRPDLLDEYQSSAEGLAKMANPNDIVDSAGLWDAEDLVEEVYNSVLSPKGIRAVRTNNGSVVFDDSLIKILERNGEKMKGIGQ